MGGVNETEVESSWNRMATLDRAIQIAVRAHSGQIDKGGAPYILHPLRLMFEMNTTVEQIVAVLHDVVEDSQWTLESLRDEGFSEEALAAVDCLTHKKGETYKDFIERVRTNALARDVKIADLADNLDVSRIPELTDTDFQRVKKYQEALAWLLGSHSIQV